MAAKNDFPLISAVAGLVIALLVAISVLAYSAFGEDNYNTQLTIQRQEYQRELADLERRYEYKVNNLQEQISSLQFIADKRDQIAQDDLAKLRREVDDLRERMKPRS